MNSRGWAAALVVAALCGLLLTQAGCPSADQAPTANVDYEPRGDSVVCGSQPAAS